jgi:hypothetical protein
MYLSSIYKKKFPPATQKEIENVLYRVKQN